MNELLFPESPAEWRDWPCFAEVWFQLTPTTCVYRALYEEYHRDNWLETARTLFDPSNTEVFVGYRIRAKGFVPVFEWYASWPLLRKGSPTGITRREAKKGPAPWDRYADDTIYAVWNRPNGTYGFTQTYMLTAGGRTQEEAERNWLQCVIPFRRIFQGIYAT